MNWNKMIGTVLMLFAVVSTSFAAIPTAKDRTLSPGAYKAKVKVLACGGCGPLVQKTLAADPAVESASVDQETRTATFTVKKGSRVNLTSLQKELDAAAQQMGMGADYGLYDVKKVAAKKTSSNPKK